MFVLAARPIDHNPLQYMLSWDNEVEDVPRNDKEWWRCPAPILVERTVDATALEVPSIDNEVEDVPRNDTGVVEVSCTDSRGDDR